MDTHGMSYINDVAIAFKYYNLIYSGQRANQFWHYLGIAGNYI